MEPQSISSDLIRGHIDTIILHTLLSGDKFAQQISDSVEQKSDGEYKINQATLYSSLKRLENLKYVNSYWHDVDEGRRKYFKLTDLGRELVETSLSDWTFSRAIIDKLMDCSSHPIYRTKYIENIVEVNKTVEKGSAESENKITEEKPAASVSPEITQTTISAVTAETAAEKIETKTEDKADEIKTEEKVESIENASLERESMQEINFRNILNGLIKANAVQKQPPAVEKTTATEPVKSAKKEEITVIDQPVEKLKFNETITTIDYNAQKSNNNGKIDFGDLTLKAAKEGYKIRISSKESAVTEGKLLINKLNLCSAAAIYAITLIELLYFTLAHGQTLKMSFLPIFLTILALTAFPVVMLVLYLKNPMKRISQKVSADSILTSGIIVFNLILITLAADILAGINFGDAFSLLMALIIPMIVFLDIVIFFCLRYFLGKTEFFVNGNKKPAKT